MSDEFEPITDDEAADRDDLQADPEERQAAIMRHPSYASLRRLARRCVEITILPKRPPTDEQL